MLYYTIISDSQNKVRREFIERNFNKIGISDLVFTDAIMAKRMIEGELTKFVIPDSYLMNEEIGCALSHIKVYKNLLQNEYNCMAIFEDDIYFTEECTLDRLAVILNTVEHWEEPFVLGLQRSQYSWKEKHKVDESLSIYSAHELYGAYGYIINKAAAEKILSIQTPIHFESDAFMFFYYLSDVKLYCLNIDLVCASTSIESTIGDERFNPNNIKAEKKRQQKRQSVYYKLYSQLPFFLKLNIMGKRIIKWIDGRLKKRAQTFKKLLVSLGLGRP